MRNCIDECELDSATILISQQPHRVHHKSALPVLILRAPLADEGDVPGLVRTLSAVENIGVHLVIKLDDIHGGRPPSIVLILDEESLLITHCLGELVEFILPVVVVGIFRVPSSSELFQLRA